jgi:hypothetical protein
LVKDQMVQHQHTQVYVAVAAVLVVLMELLGVQPQKLVVLVALMGLEAAVGDTLVGQVVLAQVVPSVLSGLVVSVHSLQLVWDHHK